MGFSSYERRLILRVVLLCLTLSLPVLVVVQGWSELLVFLVPLLLFQVGELIQFLRQAQDELNRFVKSIQFRDFSQYFGDKKDSPELQELRKRFDQIYGTFQSITKEKETQYQNLQKIVALVDTGIISYDTASGEVLVMNEALKKLLHVPHLKNFQALHKRNPNLFGEIQALPAGQSKVADAQMAHPETGPIKVLLSATTFQQDGSTYKLVSFQNVSEALDETESQAWQKLLNVMTHEIMNSVAPISSLAETLKIRVQEISRKGAFSGEMDDLEEGISTIKRRSEGLLRFAQTYRTLNKITTLHLASVSVKELFSNLYRLMQPSLEQRNVSLAIHLKNPDLTLQADPDLLDQVLINLLVNAMEAVKDCPAPHITLSAYLAPDRKKIIKVTDNGSGMSSAVQEKIFIPFFSTKKQGSGIGLSLCKQIVLLHRGTIQVQSKEGEGTTFTLRLG